MDIMLDMETMSSQPNAAIASIGAVAFNPDVITPYSEMDPSWRISLHLDLRQQEGRHFDGDTIYWWLKQSNEARGALQPPRGIAPTHPLVALQEFTRWYGVVNGGRCWSFGATFDNVLLVDLYRWCHLACPVHYRDQACARTVIQLADVGRPQIPGLVAHGALDDAIIQTIWLQQALAKLRGQTPSQTSTIVPGQISSPRDIHF